MSVVHAELIEGTYGHADEVLLAMDTAGVDTILAAVTRAAQEGSARLDHGATTHQFLIQGGAADIEFHKGTVVWRLDAAKAAEIIEFLTRMQGRTSAGHQYVGISTPADVLALSRNEYLGSLPAEATFPPPA